LLNSVAATQHRENKSSNLYLFNDTLATGGSLTDWVQ